jgi:hypothetical protein
MSEMQPLRFFRTQQHRFGNGFMIAPRARFLPDDMLTLFTRAPGPIQIAAVGYAGAAVGRQHRCRGTAARDLGVAVSELTKAELRVDLMTPMTPMPFKTISISALTEQPYQCQSGRNRPCFDRRDAHKITGEVDRVELGGHDPPRHRRSPSSRERQTTAFDNSRRCQCRNYWPVLAPRRTYRQPRRIGRVGWNLPVPE